VQTLYNLIPINVTQDPYNQSCSTQEKSEAPEIMDLVQSHPAGEHWLQWKAGLHSFCFLLVRFLPAWLYSGHYEGSQTKLLQEPEGETWRTDPQASRDGEGLSDREHTLSNETSSVKPQP
jgi:hypothetical protein